MRRVPDRSRMAFAARHPEEAMMTRAASGMADGSQSSCSMPCMSARSRPSRRTMILPNRAAWARNLGNAVAMSSRVLGRST